MVTRRVSEDFTGSSLTRRVTNKARSFTITKNKFSASPAHRIQPTIKSAAGYINYCSGSRSRQTSGELPVLLNSGEPSYVADHSPDLTTCRFTKNTHRFNTCPKR